MPKHRVTRRRVLTGVAGTAAMAGLTPFSGRADTPEVDALLVLAADISRSVDAGKFRLQRDGYASALTDRAVLSAIQRGKLKRIGLCFLEWSGGNEQQIVADWAVVGTANQQAAFAEQIRDAPRAFAGRTSISTGIDTAMSQLARAPFRADRRLIDISGDGTHNSGRSLLEAREEALAKDVTINALVILSEVPLAFNPAHTHPPGGLLAYFEDNVIGGPQAFALAAENFESFGQSIRTKLIREIAAAQSVDRA